MIQVYPGTYRHFKGGLYEVIGTATHSETQELLVIYRRYDTPAGGLWARPLSMWSERVERDGYSGPRFRSVEA